MSHTEQVKLTALDLDLKNPRFGPTEVVTTQQEALEAIVRRSPARFLNLAESIVNDGFDQIEPMIGVRTGSRVTVLEGNRRLACLLALESPGRVAAVLSDADATYFSKLATARTKGTISTLTLHIFPTEDAAVPAITRRHTGVNGGAGLVPWGSEEIKRFRARYGGTLSVSAQVLDLLRANNIETDVPEEVGLRGIASTLDRVLNTKEVRDKLGLVKKNGVLYSQYPAESLLPPLQRLVDDFRLKRLKVGDVMEVTDRKMYAERLDAPKLPKGYKVGGPKPLSELATVPVNTLAKPPSVAPSSSRTPRATRPRRTLVPNGVHLRITKPRIRDLFDELKRTDMRETPNITAVGFRVFLEVSVTNYLKLHKQFRPEREKLKEKLLDAATYMVAQGTLDEMQKRVIVKAAGDKTGNYAYSAYTLNQLVHNPDWHPDVDGLQRAWEEMQPFISALWP